MRHIFTIAILLAVLGACAKRSLLDGNDPLFYAGEVWSEAAIGLVGGSLVFTEGNPFVVGTSPDKCVTTTQCIFPDANSTPGGPVLQLYLKDCQYAAVQSAGEWRANQRLVFPSNAACEQARATGFDDGMVASLAGQTVTRTYGNGPGGNQQENWRLAGNGLAVVAYTDYPSGLSDPNLGAQVMGGMAVTFGEGGSRTLKILGAHIEAYQSVGTGAFFKNGAVDWFSITPTNTGVHILWDETLHTPAADITITGTGAKKKITAFDVYTQHNIALSVGHTKLQVGPLAWSSADCCWPTSGTLRTNFERSTEGRGPKWRSEDITFNTECGSVDYTVYPYNDAQGEPIVRHARLNHCQ